MDNFYHSVMVRSYIGFNPVSPDFFFARFVRFQNLSFGLGDHVSTAVKKVQKFKKKFIDYIKQVASWKRFDSLSRVAFI